MLNCLGLMQSHTTSPSSFTPRFRSPSLRGLARGAESKNGVARGYSAYPYKRPNLDRPVYTCSSGPAWRGPKRLHRGSMSASGWPDTLFTSLACIPSGRHFQYGKVSTPPLPSAESLGYWVRCLSPPNRLRVFLLLPFHLLFHSCRRIHHCSTRFAFQKCVWLSLVVGHLV